MQFLKHVISLLKEVFQFAWKDEVRLIVPVVLVSFGIGTLVVVGETPASFIYTLF
jgi:hypothetical protein